MEPAIVRIAGPGERSFEIANDRPLAFVLGPCVIESRDHTLMMAERIAAIAARRGGRVIFKASFDKANRTSASAFRGAGRAARPRDPRRGRGARPGCRCTTDVHESGQCAPRGGGGRCPPDSGLPQPADRPARRGGGDGQGGQRQEGTVPRPVGHGAGGRQARPRRRLRRACHRARRELRLQRAGRRHARPSGDGGGDRQAGHLRRYPLGPGAGRARHIDGR